MSYLPFETGNESRGSSIACFILTVPRLDWFKQNVLAALSQMTLTENWINLGSISIEDAAEYAAEMIEGFVVTPFNPFPAGTVQAYAGDTIPDGWLICDGSSVAVADYAKLFDAIGYTWGGSGANFNLPDLRGIMPIGAGGSYGLADAGGEATHTLDTSELPSHAHTASGTSVIDLGHTHAESAAIPTAITIGAGVPAPSALPAASITAIGNANLSVTDPTISSTGGGGAHNNLPPYVALNFIIFQGV